MGIMNADLMKTGGKWGGGGLLNEMTVKSTEWNQFKIWQLWDDWLTEPVAETDWVIEVRRPWPAV